MAESSSKYFPAIGIECHVQLKTKTKLFAAVGNDARSAPPNTLISHICLGLPGALPVLNAEAINLAIKAAFALNSRPQAFSKFDRKHYFYPDLPKGYQITQYDQPIIKDGRVVLNLDDQPKTVRVERAHLEEDAGKNSHPAGQDYSLVDLNRAGTPLLEIVSAPDLHSAREAKAYARELWLLMRYAAVSDADLYHGNMRFDVNVSISAEPDNLGIRTETKNLNSFKSVELAVDFEIRRQTALLEKKEKIVQETRGWDDAKQKTFSQRSKEDAHDYRYFPDPDLPPVALADAQIDQIAALVYLLPDGIRAKLTEIGLNSASIETILEADSAAAGQAYVKKLLEITDPQAALFAANWLVNRHIAANQNQAAEASLTSPSTAYEDLPTADQFAGVYQLYSVEKKLNSNNADLLLLALSAGGDAHGTATDLAELADQKGFIQMNDDTELSELVKTILSQNSQAAEDVKKGQAKAIGFLVGQVMKASKGAANPEIASQIIKRQLGL